MISFLYIYVYIDIIKVEFIFILLKRTKNPKTNKKIIKILIDLILQKQRNNKGLINITTKTRKK